MSIIPIPNLHVKDSPNSVHPMKTAVTGSRAPIMADGVDPMCLMAIVIKKRLSTVGSSANCIAPAHSNGPWSHCNGSPDSQPKVNIDSHPKKTTQKVNFKGE